MPQSAKDYKLTEENLKCYVLGNYATGKSVFASSFPTPGYVFDFDDGIKTYRGLDWDYDTYPMTWRGWIEFEKNLKQVTKAVGDGKYKTLILDSTTAMTDCAMERALQIDPKRSDSDGPLWNVHYQIVKNLVAPRLRAILSANCNVVMTGHWNIKTDPKSGDIVSIDPLLTGDLSTKIPGYFDEVYAAFSGTKEGKPFYYLRTSSWGHYRSRSRLSGRLSLLPDRIRNDYSTLMENVKEVLNKENTTQK